MGSCPGGEMFWYREKSWREVVLAESHPGGSCPVGSCPRTVSVCCA